MKQKIVPIVSVVVGVIAFALTFNYLRGKELDYRKKEAALYKGAAKISVMVAQHTIPAGTTIKASDIYPMLVFKKNVGGRAVIRKEGKLVLGRKILVTLEKHDPLQWSDIKGGQHAAYGLASMVKPGMRAISLAVGGAAAVSSMIQPNDRIDVLGTFTFPSKKIAGEMETVTLTVLQDVTVLATGQKLAKELPGQQSRRSSGYGTVTLEVTAREAELLVFAQQVRGRLTLSLRNPTDVSFEKDLPVTNFEYLQNKLPELNAYRQRRIRMKGNL